METETTTNANELTLVCNDGTRVNIDSKSCEMSGLLKRLIVDFTDSNILLNNEEIDGKSCKAIVEYLIHYRNTPVAEIKEIWKPIKKTNRREITHGDIWAADYIDKFPSNLV